MKNVRFQNVTFKCPFSLAGKTLDSCAFIGCSFDSVLDVRRIEIDSATVFKDNYFNNGCCIIIRPSDEIERIGIDIMSFQKLFFIIDWGWRRLGNTCVYWDARSKRFAALIDNSSRSEVTQHPESLSSEWPFDSFTQRDLDRVVLTFDKLKDYAGKLSMNDDMFGSGKQKAVSWLDYQKNQYYKQFYSKHNTLQCLQYCFLAQTYKGEGKFLFICFILIALFAVVFHVGFSKEIDLYIKDKLGPKDPKEKPKEPLKLSFDRDLIKAFFASGVIFFTPKIPFKVFKYSRSLCWWVLAEWAIGTVFMVLFLIFIAGKYPIITKLLGL